MFSETGCFNLVTWLDSRKDEGYVISFLGLGSSQQQAWSWMGYSPPPADHPGPGLPYLPRGTAVKSSLATSAQET